MKNNKRQNGEKESKENNKRKRRETLDLRKEGIGEEEEDGNRGCKIHPGCTERN